MNIDLNEDEIKLLVGLVSNAYADVNAAIDEYDECGNSLRMGDHHAQILSKALSVLRNMERRLKPITFGKPAKVEAV